MPQYQPDFSSVAAGFELLPEGIYEFKVGVGKTFEKNHPKSGLSHGVGFLLEVTEILEGGSSDALGKKAYFRCRCQDETAMSFSKQFVMAVLGYSLKDERTFNSERGDADWSYDTEDNSLGELWQELAGGTVQAAVSSHQDPDDPDREYQDFTWLSSAAAE